ncbi:hypothetical protein Pelo_18639 [Pelomyxa schiedti]|nr:hypothetical protein Pelo_18639 [Pelomyxa schiedti]
MFPIVALACCRATASSEDGEGDGGRRHAGTYLTIATAARAPAPSCIAWILNRKYRSRHGGAAAPNLPAKAGSGSNKGSREKHAETECERLRAVKEASAVLLGLCLGGHVEAAGAMLGCGGGGGDYGTGGTGDGAAAGSLPALWDGREVVRWKNAFRCGDGVISDRTNTLEYRVREYVKASCGMHTFVGSVCAAGNLRAVRWVFESVMRIPVRNAAKEALWILYSPMMSALRSGNMEVFKWMIEEFNLENLPQRVASDLFGWCERGFGPGNCQWFAEKFSISLSKDKVIGTLLQNQHFTSVEDLVWLESDAIELQLPSCILRSISNPVAAKWALKTSTVDPTESDYNRLCQNMGDVEFLQWIITEKSFTPTPATFSSACSTSNKRGSSLARWLSTRVTLQPLDIQNALVAAIRFNNTEVAEWLEATFHVMDTVNLTPENAGDTLVEICEGFDSFAESTAGLKWFVQHLSKPSTITETSIHAALSALQQHSYYRGPSSVLVLLDTFPACQLHTDKELFENIVSYFLQHDLKCLQHLFQCVGSSSASLWAPLVAKALTSSTVPLSSSKLVKWVVCKFNLRYKNIKVGDNCLLFKLLSRNKNRCAQWLLYYFDVPLMDIIQMTKRWCHTTAFHIDLTGWQIILARYPTIDVARIRKHFMTLVTMSPHVAMYTRHKYGTPTEAKCRIVLAGRYSSTLPREVKLWLGLTDD